MLRINLYSDNAKNLTEGAMITVGGTLTMTVAEAQKQALVRILLLFIFPVSLYVYQDYMYIPEQDQRIKTMSGQITELKTFNDKLQAAVSEIKRFEEEEKKINNKIKALVDLKSQRSKEIQIHQFFQISLPEKLWFNNFEYNSSQSKIQIEGTALNPSDITKLTQEVKNNVLFQQVDVPERKIDSVNGDLTNFKIVISLEAPSGQAAH